MYASSSQPPSMASSTARPLQLDHWANDKAPITSSQRASVNRLAEWLHRNSSDFKQQQQRQPPPSSQPVVEHAGKDDAANESAVDDAAVTNSVELTSIKTSDSIALPDAGAPLASAQSFLAWYTQLSDSVTSSTQTSHRQALQRISDTTNTADQLLAQLEACQVNVSELRAGTAFVQDSSRGIREQAQSLLDSQTHLDTLAEEVASRLSFFTLLPYATNMLSSPDSTIVYSQSFLELMDQLDMALLFLQQEPAKSYRDAALYRMRYAQCVTRAATLAKMAVVRDLKSEAERVTDRVKQLESSRSTSDTNASAATPAPGSKGKARELSDSEATSVDGSALDQNAADALFGDAAQQVTKLRPLIFELQKHASNTTASSTSTASAAAAEFDSLLQECKAAWFQYRRPLLSRILLQRITEIESQASNAQSQSQGRHPIVQLARAATGLTRSVLQKEHDLYQQFFSVNASDGVSSDLASSQNREPDTALSAYLAELADTFTARLRPKLSKQEDLSVLAQTASVIADAVHASVGPNEGQPLWTHSLLSVLKEAQSRLVARAQSIVSTDIAQFSASESDGDLAFPERIRTYKAASRGADAEQLAPSAAASAAVGAKAQHRRAKSGAGLLDAALSASHAASSSKAQQEKVQLFTLPPALLSTYYTPVGYTLELLYHLQALVPAAAFRRVAIAAVDACLTSVGKGASELVKRKTGDSLEREDAWLFELRQLEILREVVVSAELVLKQAHDQQAVGNGATATSGEDQGHNDDAAHVGAGTTASLVNLSSLVTAINSLWTNTGRLLYPSAVATNTDPATQLDMQPSSSHVSSRLQALIEQIATHWSDSLILPLRVYIDQSGAEASAAKFSSTYQALETCIESIIPEKADKVMLWVEDPEVHRLIVKGVTDKVGQVYERFVDMKPEGSGEVDTVGGMTDRVQAEWMKVLTV
ncbi:related to conserved oligomeric Golgi complex component 3 [Sporisorium reilianum f. sp. reilianum]|uniref:Conserved oligomeric Golgi complex subunit 3 n=1 Tax=Sporisorium reilianum f. sp. reilianum TaxID=72559 RepID=A0A2N8ULN8_9BASI|nr:related to conserved oligomeric Golgi complex component 3 [Sporisorium reilianum f. sp. reilianum]